MSLASKHALVTGANRGIGLSVARELLAAGARVSCLSRSGGTLEGEAQSVKADVTDRDGLERAFGEAAERFGPVDILVNNAGIAESAAFERSSPDMLRRILEVNLVGVFHAMQLALPGMKRANWGRIVTIASTAGLKGYAYVSAYCASKHAAVGLTRALAAEVAKTGITVNAVCPGYTETDMLGQSVTTIMETTGRSREEALRALLRQNPQGRFVQPQEVAKTVLWLCSPGSESVTGQSLALAGGELG